MAKKLQINIEELKWDDVKEDIKKANPSLFNILQQFTPKYTFIKARYRFGDKILNQGVINLPVVDGGTIPVTSVHVSDLIRKKINYNYVPLTLILTKSVEVFFETEERVMPSKLFTVGTTFGLWEAFDPQPSDFVKKVWNLSAGARTVFMLPKIADSVAHSRLRRDYGISAYPPKTLLMQNQVFADIASHAPYENSWHCDVLFFSNKWLEEQDSNPTWIKLHKYWLHEAWKQSYNCRNQMSYDVAWEAFSREVTRRNWKPRPYIINTIKHLMTIGEGLFPGFSPADGDEMALPSQLIQNAYINSYLIKQAPIIMQPCHLKSADNPVYYSLSLPTLLEYAPQAYGAPSLMADMRELKMLMDLLLKSTNERLVNYEFFHSDLDSFREIRSVREMLETDKNLARHFKKHELLKFPDNSPFFHGCVRISLR